jgi:hypothetical protein
MTSAKQAPRSMNTKYGIIKRVAKFKYLGEIIQPNALDKEGNRARCRKMETAFQLTKNMYNKKSISLNAKLRLYNTVIKQECLYASECLTMNTNKEMEEIAKKERKIVRRILGSRQENGIFKLRSNKEVYEKVEKVRDTMRKRRVTFYAHIKRMNENRLTKKIFNFFDRNPKTPLNWFKEVKADLLEINISNSDIQNRNIFRRKVQEFKGFEEKRRRTGGATWREENNIGNA